MPFPFFRRPSARPGQAIKPVLKNPIVQAKPKSEPKPGIFGDKGDRTLLQMRTFAKRSPYKSYSKLTSKRLSGKERIGLINKWAKEMGRSHSLSTTDFNRLIAKKTRELTWVKPAKKKELKIEIDTLKSWKKG